MSVDSLGNDNIPFQDTALSKDNLFLPAWTKSQTVALYILFLKPGGGGGAAFAFWLHCG